VVALSAVKRPGWTLPEMLVTLVVMGAIFTLAAHHALGQMRFFESASTIAKMRGQVGHASAIVARAVHDLAPADLVIALDSAIEFRAPIGTAVVCTAAPGHMVLPFRRARGNTFAAWWSDPDFDDQAHVHFSDSTGASWLTLHVAAPPTLGPACPRLGELSPGLLVQLREPVAVPPGAVVRFTRAVRFSLYRASDARWYLGAREWNGAGARFNTIQPVAGPLGAFSAFSERSGLALRYFDADGGELEPPFDLATLAAIRVTSRAESERVVRIQGQASHGRAHGDSLSVHVTLRNR
jgi:prepilin-type N-terminal cleavage/methylation domain-containing protein